jgi:hypothetical protein
MSLTSSIKLIASAIQTSSLDLGSAKFRPSISSTLSFADGAGAAAANLIFTDTRTLAASATENLDLAGVLTDAYGATITFARLKAVIVTAAAANTNDVQVTRPASNGVPMFMAAGDGIALKPGAFFAWADPGATGAVVTASTGDILTVTNSAGTTGVTYSILILGAAT